MGQEPDRRPSSVVRLAISVEGQTEEQFVKTVVTPYLQNLNIYVQAILLGKNGGNVSLRRIEKDLNLLANNFDKVTTLYDFYGFSGKEDGETKESLEQKIIACVASPLQNQIIPYLQMFEFEGILFSSPEAIENNINQTGLANWAKTVLDQFNNDPERINDSPHTAPSKRLANKANYIKTVHGPNICKEIGLDVLRQRCAGFNSWLSSLEALQE